MINVLQALVDGPSEEQLIEINQDGYPVHVKFMRAAVNTDRLIITFHGAISRKGERPLFDRTKSIKSLSQFAHQLTIFDPTIVKNDRLAIGWYLGGNDYPAPTVLKSFISQAIESLQASRVIFFGSSVGGFAALYHSFFSPGSIAIPVVPHTRTRHYSGESGVRAFPGYCKTCWPGLSEEEVETRLCLDVTKLYASEPFRNSVVYLMSPGDNRHFSQHASPFLSEVYSSLELNEINLSMVSDYWGVPGHSGAVPAIGFLPWVKAALTSPTIAQQDILDTYTTIRDRQLKSAAKKTAAPKDLASLRAPHVFAENDLAMAKLLQRYQLASGGQ